MKAWVYDRSQPASLALRDVPDPRPDADQVVVKLRGTSVCGTDEQMFHGQVAGVANGIIPGHEICGEILEIGSKVHEVMASRGMAPVSVGALTAAESHYHVPGGLDEGIIGIWGPLKPDGTRYLPLNGGYAEYVALPAECLYPLPPALVEDFWPSLLEAAGNDALIGQYLGSVQAKHVGIVGCGPHGLYAQIFARHFGAEQIVAFEVDPVRMEFAKNLGVADAVLDSRDPELDAKVADLTGGQGFDAVVDIAGKYQAVLDLCVKYTRDGGHLVLFGLYGDPKILLAGQQPDDIIFARKEFDLKVNGKAMQVAGITGRSHEIWTYLIDALAQEKEFRAAVQSPLTNLGPLENLGPDTEKRDPNVLKRGYSPFS